QQNAFHLTGQIEDLVTFSRAGKLTRKIRYQPTETVNHVFEETRVLNAGCQVKLEVIDLPEIIADPDLMRRLFQELFSNAFKATRGRPDACIRVTGVMEQGATTFTVEDNGIGFEKKHEDKLFQVFQKLHPNEEFSGNGMGLAVVKRIVLTHGGCIRAELKPGGGTRFCFSLPFRPEHLEPEEEQS